MEIQKRAFIIRLLSLIDLYNFHQHQNAADFRYFGGIRSERAILPFDGEVARS